jgi:hypothetical protein
LPFLRHSLAVPHPELGVAPSAVDVQTSRIVAVYWSCRNDRRGVPASRMRQVKST